MFSHLKEIRIISLDDEWPTGFSEAKLFQPMVLLHKPHKILEKDSSIWTTFTSLMISPINRVKSKNKFPKNSNRMLFCPTSIGPEISPIKTLIHGPVNSEAKSEKADIDYTGACEEVVSPKEAVCPTVKEEVASPKAKKTEEKDEIKDIILYNIKILGLSINTKNGYKILDTQ